MRARKTTAGFTLVEVLAAVVVMSFVVALVYSTWSATLQVTETGTQAAEGVQRERMAMKAVTEALAGATWYENRPEQSLQLDHAEGFNRLELISRVPPGFWGERALGGHSLRRIEFRTEPHENGGYQLVMLQQSLIAPVHAPQIHRTVLLPQMETFDVEVKPAEATAPWQSSWPAGETNALPRQARVTLAVQAHSPNRRTVPLFAHATVHSPAVPVIGRVVRTSEVDFGEDGFDVDESDAAGRLVFIIDKSLSMRGIRLQMAKDALLNTLSQLGEEQKFYIYFFSGKTHALPSAMLDATPDNKLRVRDWVNAQEAEYHDKGIMDALKGAFLHEPTEVALLTDGAPFAPGFRKLISELNADQKVKVNTYGVGERMSGPTGEETLLMLIAKENGGTYTSILAVDPDAPRFGTPPGKRTRSTPTTPAIPKKE